MSALSEAKNALRVFDESLDADPAYAVPGPTLVIALRNLIIESERALEVAASSQ